MAYPQPGKPNPIEFLAKFDTSVLAGLVFLAFGGGIISFYYSHIKYLPDIEWTQSIVHLATATLIGGGLAILLALSLFLPGCMWSAFLLRDDRLQKAFCFHKATDEVCLWTLISNIGLPFGVVILLNHICLVGAEKLPQDLLPYIYVTVSAILLIWVGRRINHNFENLLGKEQENEDETEKQKDRDNFGLKLLKYIVWLLVSIKGLDTQRGRRLFKYIFWFLLSIIVSQVSMLLIYLFSGRPPGAAFLITTFFCTLGVLISNHFVAIHYEKSRVQSVLVSLVIAALLLFIADRNSNLSVQVLAFFGLGDKSESVDLLLNKEGADASEGLGLHERCTPKLKERLCNVKVLSRLGNEYLLKVDDQIFSFPKSDVISRISRPSALDQKK